MLRIIHVDTGRELRGGQWQLLLLARGLRDRGHEQLVVCPAASALAEATRREGLAVLDLPEHDPFTAHGMVQLRDRLRIAPPDILHAHDGRGQTIASLASLGVPLHHVAHRRVTFLPPAHAGGRTLFAFKYRHTCEAVIAVSQFIKSRLSDCGVPEGMIEVIPDGVEIPRELPEEVERREAREHWGFSIREFVVGCLSASTLEKGLDVALEAARLLETRLPGTRMVLAVAGPLRDSAARTSASNARFVPPPADLGRFFAGLDLYLVPSRAEGLGSSALLAMAHGVPVAASNVGGLPEIVSDGATGWLFAPGSAEALAAAVVDAASDGARLREFGSRGRERVREFAVEKTVERTESLYSRLVTRRR